jgi:leucyl aminopeptidase
MVQLKLLSKEQDVEELYSLDRLAISYKTPLDYLGGALALNPAPTVAFDATVPDEYILGYVLRSMQPKKYSKQNPVPERQVFVREDVLQRLNPLVQGIALARELAGAPANRMTPQIFCEKLQELTQQGLKVEILDEKEIVKQGLQAIWSVGQSSINKPRLAIIRWEGSNEQPVLIVGKGVCYDAGGINIKNTHQIQMKWDKAGGAAVAGTLLTAALKKSKRNIVGIIGLVENLLDGCCMKPGDVIDTYSGLTVEIMDTDNEGRLVLADCLSYGQKQYNPKTIIDLGTLTPEVFASLAGEYAGLFSENPVISKELISAGELSQEKVWPLPMGACFARQIESDIADVKNMGIPGFGDSGAAAEFLKKFVKPEVAWAHLDIAGVAWSDEDAVLAPKGVNGFGVRLLTEWLKD